MRRRRVAVLGSTGSIGRATLDVIARHPDRFEVHALAARTSARSLVAQARRTGARRAVLTDFAACERARRALGSACDVGWGLDALIDVATDHRTDIVVMAMSGTMGLLPVVAAIEQGKRIAFATKELLVSFGVKVMQLAARHNAEVLPIDSELSALHQCLRSGRKGEVRRVILTASGGPFRRTGPPARATVKRVLAHPTWNMGRKITVDSASLMNKGLEVIETVRLFGLDPSRVTAVIHPQSIIHSMVEFTDGSIVAQLSHPDMRLPIQYCLTWPERIDAPVRPLRLEEIRSLDFTPVDRKRFPCFGLAHQALAAGPGATCVLNAANQVAAEAFLTGEIAFGDIPVIIKKTLHKHQSRRPARNPGIHSLLALERWAHGYAVELTVKGRN